MNGTATRESRRESLALVVSLPRRTLGALALWLPFLLLLAIAAPAPSAHASTTASLEAAAGMAGDTPGGQPAEGTTAPAGTPAATDADKDKPASAVNPVIAERLVRANSYLEDGRFDDALSVVDELRHVRRQKPIDEAQIHRFRGYILIAKGDTAGAAVEFEAALATGALDSGSSQGMVYSLAQIYAQAGKYDRALTLLDGWFATEKDPKPEAWFLKAMILVQQGDYKAALGPATIANDRAPQPRESWLQLLASVQFQLADYPALADTLRRLVAVAPGQKRYWVQLATIENSIGKENEALASIGIAHDAGLLAEDKELRQRARMCFVRELPDCCVQTLEEGLASGAVKPDADAYRLLANCRIASREVEDALAPLAKAAELGDGARSWLLLGQLQLQREDWNAARGALQKALAGIDPAQRSSVELLLGIAMLGSKDFDDAEKVFRAAATDEKTRVAADSYLRHLEQQRALLQLREGSTTAGTDSAGAVSHAGASESGTM